MPSFPTPWQLEVPRLQTETPLSIHPGDEPWIGPLATIRLRYEPGWGVVEVEGELDLANREDLLTCLEMGLRARDHVYADLRKVRFIDCAAVGVLVRAHKRAVRTGKKLIVVAEHPCVPRLLGMVGADLPVFSAAAPSVLA
jgi:anti-anti-sigma factor